MRDLLFPGGKDEGVKDEGVKDEGVKDGPTETLGGEVEKVKETVGGEKEGKGTKDVGKDEGETKEALVEPKKGKNELQKVIARVYSEKSGRPSAEDIVVAINELIGEDDAEELLNEPQFAWDLMEIIGVESGSKLHEQIKLVTREPSKLKLKIASELLGKRWTLRHYTTSKSGTPGYDKLRSTLELTARNIKKSEHTNDADWNQVGNVGFSFYLLCVDGVAPAPTFLNTCTHYAEFDIEEVPQLFVSGDMLGSTSKKKEHKSPGGLRGTGSLIKQALATMDGVSSSSPSAFLASLDNLFTNFEVKVPGMLTVKEWIAT
jgi:hypothetical protein